MVKHKQSMKTLLWTLDGAFRLINLLSSPYLRYVVFGHAVMARIIQHKYIR